jgi:hypothetical protein
MQAAHARHYATMLTAEVHDGRVDCRREIDNIRAALRWASGPVGDRELFVRLAAVSAPYWLELSLLTECAEWMARAIAVLSPSESGTRTEMCLCSALGFAMMFTTGMTDAAYDALAHALKLATALAISITRCGTCSRSACSCCVDRISKPHWRWHINARTLPRT